MLELWPCQPADAAWEAEDGASRLASSSPQSEYTASAMEAADDAMDMPAARNDLLQQLAAGTPPNALDRACTRAPDRRSEYAVGEKVGD